MTIDERYSLASFAAGFDRSPEQLVPVVASLQEEIAAVLRPVAAGVIADVVDQLNALGHRLTPLARDGYDDHIDIDYHDEDDPPLGWHCRLRVGADIVISVGYGPVASYGVSIWPADDDTNDR